MFNPLEFMLYVSNKCLYINLKLINNTLTFLLLLKVSINGYVSLGKKYQTAYPRPFPAPANFSIIAPFFADADARGYTSSGVLMHEYFDTDNSTTAQGIFRRAKLDLSNLQNYMRNNPSSTEYGVFNQTLNGFVPSHVIIITWQDLLPSPSVYYVNLRTVMLD